jgi:hypothetical protein
MIVGAILGGLLSTPGGLDDTFAGAMCGLAIELSLRALFVFLPPIRFSLRALLIATTLASVTLGLVAWLARK